MLRMYFMFLWKPHVMVRFGPPCFCGVAYCTFMQNVYVFQLPHSTVLYTVKKIPLSLRERPISCENKDVQTLPSTVKRKKQESETISKSLAKCDLMCLSNESTTKFIYKGEIHFNARLKTSHTWQLAWKQMAQYKSAPTFMKKGWWKNKELLLTIRAGLLPTTRPKVPERTVHHNQLWCQRFSAVTPHLWGCAPTFPNTKAYCICIFKSRCLKNDIKPHGCSHLCT